MVYRGLKALCPYIQASAEIDNIMGAQPDKDYVYYVSDEYYHAIKVGNLIVIFIFLSGAQQGELHGLL